MENLSRENILRMFGLRSSDIGGRLDALEMGFENNNNVLEKYWTDIIKNEKEITLIAGRETENETNIAQLQVTAREISARVSTVSNEVDEISGVVTQHTTKIGQLEVSDSQIRASVQTVSDTVTTQGQTIDGLSSTVSSHTTKIGQLEVSDSQIRSSVSTLTTTVNGHTSKISTLEQTDSTIQASVSSLSSTVGTNTSDIASLKIKANSIDLRVEEIEDDYATSADLSLYVPKNSVSWLTGSADNVIFNFNNRFQIQHLGTAVLEVKANGDLEITGTLKPYSNIGTINPIQIDSSGNINRKAPDGSVIPLYAGRYVRYLNYASLAGRTYTMSADDDYVICNGNYSDKKVYLPQSPAQGKVVSIKSIGGKVLIYTSNSNHGIRKTDTIETQPVELSNYDRAELVFYAGTWWWNYMSI